MLQPSLGYLALFEFHPKTLATPLLLGAVVALAAGRSRTAILCAAAAALAKEDVALPIAVLGMVHALRASRGRGTGLALLGVAAGSLALSFLVLKLALAHGEADYGAMYARWGHGPGEIMARLPSERASWHAVRHMHEIGRAPENKQHPDHALAQDLARGFWASLPYLDTSLIASLLSRARRIAKPDDVAALASTVDTEAFRAALGRIACGYDGGQIVDE